MKFQGLLVYLKKKKKKKKIIYILKYRLMKFLPRVSIKNKYFVM